MSAIADFTKSELWIINTTLEERYGKPVELQLADTELRLNPYETELSTGEEEYDDLSECMVTLLQVQADHVASKDTGETGL